MTWQSIVFGLGAVSAPLASVVSTTGIDGGGLSTFSVSALAVSLLAWSLNRTKSLEAKMESKEKEWESKLSAKEEKWDARYSAREKELQELLWSREKENRRHRKHLTKTYQKLASLGYEGGSLMEEMEDE